MLRALAVETSESEDSEGTDEESESDPTSSTSFRLVATSISGRDTTGPAGTGTETSIVAFVDFRSGLAYMGSPHRAANGTAKRLSEAWPPTGHGSTKAPTTAGSE